MNRLFNYIVVIGFLLSLPALVLAAGPPRIDHVNGCAEVGGSCVEATVSPGDKQIIIRGENLTPVNVLLIGDVDVTPLSATATEVVAKLSSPAQVGTIRIRLASSGGAETIHNIRVEPTTNPNLRTNINNEVDSNLTCTEQGLVKDANTGLCLPANPFGSQTGTVAGSKSVGGLIKSILDILLTLGGVVAILFIVIGGYQYVTSRGNENQAKEGQKTITYAVMGLIAMLLAYMLVTVVTNLFTKSSVF